jgi:penicillin-binding protein 2
VIAFVSTPTFDPNGFARGLTYAEYAALSENIDVPLFDRALRGEYPPGSTIKPLIALGALEDGVVDTDTTKLCRGAFQLPGSSHRFRDWKKGGHGTVNMHSAIAQSCDVYFYGVAERMGIGRLHDSLAEFGLGAATGIDIRGERKGLVPSPEWKQKAFKRKDLQTWFPGETVIAGIGQGYMLTTPLQLAYAMAILANDGVVYKPHIVKYVEDVATGEKRAVEPEPSRTFKLAKKNVEIVKAAMVDVARPGGTAGKAFQGAEYASGGKTGTAQVIGMKAGEKYDEKKIAERFRDHALYVAFAPADKPRIALGILVENGGHGGSTAGPIARAVFDYYLLGKVPANQLDLNPDSPEAD